MLQIIVKSNNGIFRRGDIVRSKVNESIYVLVTSPYGSGSDCFSGAVLSGNKDNEGQGEYSENWNLSMFAISDLTFKG